MTHRWYAFLWDHMKSFLSPDLLLTLSTLSYKSWDLCRSSTAQRIVLRLGSCVTSPVTMRIGWDHRDVTTAHPSKTHSGQTNPQSWRNIPGEKYSKTWSQTVGCVLQSRLNSCECCRSRPSVMASSLRQAQAPTCVRPKQTAGLDSRQT